MLELQRNIKAKTRRWFIAIVAIVTGPFACCEAAYRVSTAGLPDEPQFSAFSLARGGTIQSTLHDCKLPTDLRREAVQPWTIVRRVLSRQTHRGLSLSAVAARAWLQDSINVSGRHSMEWQVLWWAAEVSVSRASTGEQQAAFLAQTGLCRPRN